MSSHCIGKLQKNSSLSALNLNQEKIASIEKTISSAGLSQETVELRPSTHNTEEDPEEILQKLNDFNVILKEPIICSGFRKFLARSFCSENLLFWKEIENYRNISDPEELRKRAVEIFRDYITQSAENEINLPHTEKVKLQKALVDPSFMPPPSFFDTAQIEIYSLMKRDSFLNYLKDPIFDETKKILERVRCLSVESVSGDELTERDWTLILTEAKEVEFQPGDRIVEQDQKNTFLYQLKSGKLQVEKNISGTNIPIAMLEKSGTIFGEMSVLGKLGVATASIVAASSVVVARLEVPFIFALFLTDPLLARRFYVNMGIKLAKLLQDISSLTPSNSKPPAPSPSPGSRGPPRPLLRMNTSTRIAKEQIEGTKKEVSDRTYHERFGLPANELVVKEIICDLEKMVSRRGTLYISQHYICFYSKIFGQKTKEVINIRHLTEIKERNDAKHHSLTILTQSKSKLKFQFKTKDDCITAQAVIQDFKTASEGSSNSSENLLPKLNTSNPNILINSNNNNNIDNNNNNVDDSQSLTPEDWEILLGINKQSILTFTKGDAILIEGQHYQMICQIVSGNCRIEKQLPDQPDISIVLGKMKPGEIFGEITFLTEGPATASVYADDDFVDMYFIDGKYLKETLLETHPQVVVRFYNYLCINLAKRIAQREKEGWRKR